MQLHLKVKTIYFAYRLQVEAINCGSGASRTVKHPEAQDNLVFYGYKTARIPVWNQLGLLHSWVQSPKNPDFHPVLR